MPGFKTFCRPHAQCVILCMTEISSTVSGNNIQSKITPKIKTKEQKQKYRGMFETQKSGNKTSSGDIGLNTCKSQSGTGPDVRRSASSVKLLNTFLYFSCSTLRGVYILRGDNNLDTDLF